MRKLACFLLSFFIMASAFAWNENWYIGKQKLRGDKNTGIYFDPDNDQTVEITFDKNGAILFDDDGGLRYNKATDKMEYTNDNQVSWDEIGSGGGSSPLTTKGDLYTYTTEDARLAVGTNTYLLSANSSEATGLEWIDPTTVGVTDHGALNGLGDDDHSQYLLLNGRSGGQTAYGSTDASEDLNLYSTSNATKGNINFGSGTDQMYYDETLGALAVGKDTHQNVVAGMTFTGLFATHVDDGDSLVAGIGCERAEDTTSTLGATIFGGRSRGTLASRTIVQDDDRIMSIAAVGRDGTDFALAGRIDFESDGTPGSDDMPGRIVLSTTPDGSQTPVERVRVQADGNLGIGTASPAQTLEVSGTGAITGDTTVGSNSSITSGMRMALQGGIAIGDNATTMTITDVGGGETTVSNGSLLDDDTTSLTGWTQQIVGTATSTQETAYGREAFRFNVPAGGGTDEARRERDVGSVGNRLVFSTDIYTEAFNTTGGPDIRIHTATQRIILRIYSDSIKKLASGMTTIYSFTPSAEAWNSISVDFDVLNDTYDIYWNTVKVVDDTACETGGSYTDGLVSVGANQAAGATDTYFNTVKVGDGFVSAGAANLPDNGVIIGNTNVADSFIGQTNNYLRVEGKTRLVDDVQMDADLDVTGEALIQGGVNVDDVYTLTEFATDQSLSLSSLASGDTTTYWRAVREHNPLPQSDWEDGNLASVGIMTDLHYPSTVGSPISEATVVSICEGMNEAQVDFALMLGDDLGGRSPEDADAWLPDWATVASWVWPLKTSLIRVIGNHEIYTFGDTDAEYDTALANFVAVNNETVPYSYWDYHGIRFFRLASIYDDNVSDDWGDSGFIGSTQLSWFDTNVDATSTDIPIVVFTHYDPYNYSDTDIQGVLEDFETAGGTVLVVLSGHDHDNAKNTVNGIDYIRLQRPTDVTVTYSKITFDPNDIDGDGDKYYIEGEGGQTDYNGTPPLRGLEVGDGAFTGEVTIEGDIAANIPLQVKGATSQTGRLFQILDSTDNAVLDVFPTGAISNEDGIRTVNPQYSAGFWIQENGENTPEHTNQTGYYDHTGGAFETLLTKSTGDDFTSADEGNWVVFITASRQICEIKEYVSATQVIVQGLGWDSDIGSVGSPESFFTYKHPAVVSGNGFNHEFNVGDEGEFEVVGYDFAGDNVMEIEYNSAEDGTDGLKIESEGEGYNAVTGLVIDYKSGNLQPGDIGAGAEITLDITEAASADTTTTVTGLSLSVIDGTNATSNAITVLPGFGSALSVQGADIEDPDYGYENTLTAVTDRVNGTPQDGTAFLDSSTSDLEIFDNDDDYILIGSDNIFEILEVVLDVGSSKNIIPNFFYSQAGGVWPALTIKSDGTVGMQQSNFIVWDDPGDWTKDDEDLDGNAITNAYYVAIQRTYSTPINTLPTESYFKTAESQDTGMKITGSGAVGLIKIVADPCGDTTQFPTGSIWYNSSSDYCCFCDSSGIDKKVSDNSACF